MNLATFCMFSVSIAFSVQVYMQPTWRNDAYLADRDAPRADRAYMMTDNLQGC